jgi:ubiquinone/menaquinone biosynthesis C-methylase UbiE
MSEQKVSEDAREYYDKAIEWLSQHTQSRWDNFYWRQTVVSLQRWIADLGLSRGRVLEIGTAHGMLQDLVPNYIGSDITVRAGDQTHKPFCACSGTELPFADNSFDAVWSIWVLEHVEQPERMLDEIRRVVKPGGSVFICAAFAVDSWISQGLHKRPFTDLTLRQRLTKVTIPVRSSNLYKIATTLPLRLGELLAYLGRRKPTRLCYRTLQPNYEHFWDNDADAVASLDSYNLALYFLSRGDRPYFSDGMARSLLRRSQPQAYIIRKGKAGAARYPKFKRAWDW